MSSDFNAPESSRMNTGIESLLGARDRKMYDLFIGFEPTTPTGKIGEGVHFPSQRSYALTGDLDDDWARQSFTLRMWFKFDADAMEFATFNMAFHFATPLLFVLRKETYIPGAPDEKYPMLTWAVGGAEVQKFDLAGGFGGGGTFLSPDVWHRVIVWYDEEASEIGLQIDNETPVTAAIVTLIGPGVNPAFVLGDNSFDFTNDINYDELALWNGYVLTEADRLADWNSGAGIGWPAITTAVPTEPMAYWRLDAEDLVDNTEAIPEPSYWNTTGGNIGPSAYPFRIANMTR